MENESIKEAIKSIADGLVKRSLDEASKEYSEIVDLFKEIITSTKISDMYIRFNYNIEKALKVAINEVYGEYKEEVFFLINHSSFVDNHFTKFIKTNEGYVCSADKAGYILTHLFKYYTENKGMDFSNKDHYWIPQSLDASDVIIFFESIYALYYGNFRKYVDFLNYYNIKQTGELNADN